MIHMQNPFPDWPDAMLAMPDYSSIKILFNAGVLREAKEKWTAAGRDPNKLFTDYRYDNYQLLETTDTAAQRAHWERMFFQAIDGTYLREHAAYIDGFEEHNEYLDTRHARIPGFEPYKEASARAAAWVWNNKFRGRRVVSPDGGEGDIPANCRLILGNVAVGNDIPKWLFQIVKEYDLILGYHPYMHIVNGIRDPGCWRFHSGRCFFNEAEYGIKVPWALTECGPYASTSDGWRHPGVLGGNLDLFVKYHVEWLTQLATTDAYKRGDIVGYNIFTGGHVGWPWYEVDTPQYIRLADASRLLWKPGQPADGDDMDAELKRQLLELAGGMKASAESMIALLEGDEPAPVHDLRDKTNQAVINVFSKAFGSAAYIVKIGQAVGTYPIYQNRAALYTGPAIESMPISDSDKAELIAALG